MADVLPHAMNLLAFGADAPVKHLQGKPEFAIGNQTKRQIIAAATPPDPKRKAIQRDMLARASASAVLGSGRGATLLTGQQGVSGQAETSVPSLLGR